MKQAIFCILIITLGLFSCKKFIPESEQIANFIVEHDLDMAVTESGLFYKIYDEGVGDHPTDASTVTVHYTGTLLDGTIFDGTTVTNPASLNLSGTIEGWQEGIPLLKRGGSATFIIPSELGYGQTGQGAVIGPNTPLVFDVDLIDF